MTWEEFLSDAKAIKGLATQKISEATDLATLRVRLATVEYRLKSAYESLGKTAYRHFTADGDRVEALAKGVESVTLLRAEAKFLREQIEKMTKSEPKETTASAEPVEPAEPEEK